MLRMGSWLYGKKAASASTQSFDALSELQDLEDAMRAAILILNDDVDGAEAGLDRGTSSFHKTGKGIVAFVRATLGFEQDVMRQASERLGEAESSCASDQQRALHNQHAPHAYHSQIYTAGTEFALCQAAAQLMSAVVGVLNESLTEGLKGFYKMRKAFITLDGILKMEEQFIRARSTTMLASAVESKLSSRQPSRTNLANQELKVKTVSQRAIEATTPSSGPQSGQTSQYATPLESPGLEKGMLDLTTADDLAEAPVPTETSTPSATSMLDHDPESEIFSNPLDVFVHSGANCCFGLLLLLISMVPPSFSRLLSIIGFRGDKRRGLRMLWQASKFHNLMGAIAALTLLGYYNAFVRYCEIMPDVTSSEDRGIEGYPQERLTALLAEMRERFPNSQLWLLEHSRMNGANKNLRGALNLLQTGSKSPLKQVEALKMFEKSLNAMYLHEYQLCTDSFVGCVDLNSWSPTLYYYIAGCAQLALYRRTLQSDASAASQYAKTATEHFQHAPTLAGKKRFMAKQLPFDVYVTRKVAKWESRAKERKVSLVDAIGVDPLEEMIFFWNGHSRMTQQELEESLTNLAWCESDANATSWSREGAEEKAILDVLRAAIYRSLHRHGEAKEILRTRVLNLDKSLFKGHLKDDWVLPVAHFEMAANLWMERPSYMAIHNSSSAPSSQPSSEHLVANDDDDDVVERTKVRECKEYLDKAAKWETFVLDTRLGLKVAAAVDAVQKWEDAHPAPSV